jgi:hypothetical protein
MMGIFRLAGGGGQSKNRSSVGVRSHDRLRALGWRVGMALAGTPHPKRIIVPLRRPL